MEQPKYIPISLAVFKKYGKDPAIFYGYALVLGAKLKTAFGDNDADLAQFVGMTKRNMERARGVLIKSEVLDTNYEPLKPPTEPLTVTTNAFVPGIVFVPTSMLKLLGYERAVMLGLVCVVTAVNGSMAANVTFWQWLLDVDHTKARKLLKSLILKKLLKVTKVSYPYYTSAMVRVVPTEQAWNLFLYSPTDISRQ